MIFGKDTPQRTSAPLTGCKMPAIIPLTDDCQFDIIQNPVLVEGTECNSID
jgi:hypothetical protein